MKDPVAVTEANCGSLGAGFGERFLLESTFLTIIARSTFFFGVLICPTVLNLMFLTRDRTTSPRNCLTEDTHDIQRLLIMPRQCDYLNSDWKSDGSGVFTLAKHAIENGRAWTRRLPDILLKTDSGDGNNTSWIVYQIVLIATRE